MREFPGQSPFLEPCSKAHSGPCSPGLGSDDRATADGRTSTHVCTCCRTESEGSPARHVGLNTLRRRHIHEQSLNSETNPSPTPYSHACIRCLKRSGIQHIMFRPDLMRPPRAAICPDLLPGCRSKFRDTTVSDCGWKGTPSLHNRRHLPL